MTDHDDADRVDALRPADDLDHLAELDDAASLTGEFAEGTLEDGPPLGEPLRVKRWLTLGDAVLDVAAAEGLALLADLTIEYDRHDRCSFRVRWYEAPTTVPVGPLGVDPGTGDIVEAAR